MYANPVENPNRWNDDNQVFSRNYCFSPALTSGSFCSNSFLILISKPFFHAPNWRPTSSSFNDSSLYLAVGINLLSHASWRKNFRTSNREIVRLRRMIFCSGGQVRRSEAPLQTIEKAMFNLLANAQSLNLWQITLDRQPKLIGIFFNDNHFG